MLFSWLKLAAWFSYLEDGKDHNSINETKVVNMEFSICLFPESGKIVEKNWIHVFHSLSNSYRDLYFSFVGIFFVGHQRLRNMEI